MNGEQRETLKKLVDAATRDRVDRGYGDCDPESLTIKADEADVQGYPEIAEALRNFRDKVVNPLLGEGWTLDRIEQAAMRHWSHNG